MFLMKFDSLGHGVEESGDGDWYKANECEGDPRPTLGAKRQHRAGQNYDRRNEREDLHPSG